MIDLVKYKNTISNFSLDELIKMREEMGAALLNMMLDEDLISKIVIVENLIEERKAQSAEEK